MIHPPSDNVAERGMVACARALTPKYECHDALDAVADAWASIDGKLDEYRAGRLATSILDEPGGHFSGYQADAGELIRRIEKRGFKLVAIAQEAHATGPNPLLFTQHGPREV